MEDAVCLAVVPRRSGPGASAESELLVRSALSARGWSRTRARAYTLSGHRALSIHHRILFKNYASESAKEAEAQYEAEQAAGSEKGGGKGSAVSRLLASPFASPFGSRSAQSSPQAEMV